MCKIMEELKDEATFNAKVEAVISIMETLALSSTGCSENTYDSRI